MRKRQIGVLFAAAALIVSMLSGCGKGTERMNTTAAAQTPSEALSAENPDDAQSPDEEEGSAGDWEAIPEEESAAGSGTAEAASSGETEREENAGAAAADKTSAQAKPAQSAGSAADVSGNSSAAAGTAPSLNGTGSTVNAAVETVYEDAPGVVTALDGTQLRICIFGDDQFDLDRGADGISALVSKYCCAEVFNCAISGTTAAMDESDNADDNHWGSVSLCGMVRAAVGELDPSFISAYENAYRNFCSCDFSRTDVFVLSYGANDFRGGYQLATDFTEDRYTYAGSLNYSLRMLKRQFPNAQIIVITPCYAAYFDGEHFLGDTNIWQNSYGTMLQYVDTAIAAAKAYNFDYIDAYRWLGVTGENYWKYLDDGVYFNAQTKRNLAQMISRLILRHNGYDVPTETNLDTLDYSTLIRFEEAED